MLSKRQKIIDDIIKKYSSPDKTKRFAGQDYFSYQKYLAERKGFANNKEYESGDRDVYFMKCALELAEAAAYFDEVPVGAVVVRENKIIAADFNGREALRDATRHAELSAIRAACSALGGWRLVGCELFVTLEPCPMCAGAIINARIPRTVIGADDQKFGAFGSAADINNIEGSYKTELTKNILSEESSSLLREFFLKKRKQP